MIFLSYVVLGCDQNNGNDSKWQNTVKAALEKEGHKVEKLAIAPGPFAEYSYQNKAKGKIGVYIMADSLVSVADLAYGSTHFKYGYFIIRGDCDRPRMKTMEHFENNPIGRDLDCTSICDKLAGKSYGQMNPLIKNRCQITFGRNPDEGANNLIKLMGGEGTDSNKKSSSGSTIKEALKKVVSKWDGEIEIRVVDDTVYVNKIKDPTSAKLTLSELNVHYDSISITDVKPKTVNQLILVYNNKELIIKDDNLIKRYGVQTSTLKSNTKFKNLTEAKNYLNREWNKIKRSNGRQLECKVNGSLSWTIGKWVRVYLPRVHIDDYMYISKVSHDEDGGNNWTTSLTLVDYPPSFGADTDKKKKSTKTSNKTSTT